MNWFAVLVGFIEFVAALVIGIFFIFGSFMVFKRLTKGINEISELKKNNTAVALYYGSCIFAICWVIKSTIEPVVNALTTVMRNPEANFLSYLAIAGIMVAQIAIAGVMTFAGVMLGVKVFTVLTRNIDEMAEIKKNNIAVAVMLVAIVVSIALFIEPGIRVLINGLIPFPKIDTTL